MPAGAASRYQIAIYPSVALISLASLADATYVTALAFSDEAVVCGGSCFGASKRRPRMINMTRLEPGLLKVPVADN